MFNKISNIDIDNLINLGLVNHVGIIQDESAQPGEFTSRLVFNMKKTAEADKHKITDLFSDNIIGSIIHGVRTHEKWCGYQYTGNSIKIESILKQRKDIHLAVGYNRYTGYVILGSY